MTSLKEAFGFHIGQRVKMLVPCTGADHDDIEHTTEPGAIGTIDYIERLTTQGINFHVVIPVYHQGKVQYDPKEDDARFRALRLCPARRPGITKRFRNRFNLNSKRRPQC